MKQNNIIKTLFALIIALVLTGCPDDAINNDDVQTLPILTAGTAEAAISLQSENVYTIDITIPAGVTAAQINLIDGVNFNFTGKTFNFNINFANGIYNEDIVYAITAKLTEKSATIGAINTTPQKPGTTITVPTLTVGTGSATITQQGTTNTYNVNITIPGGATTAQVNLTDGTNFTYAGKTFNFNITFANGTYDEAMVDAITIKFIAKGGTEGTVTTSPQKPGVGTMLPILTIGTATATITQQGTTSTYNVNITVPVGATTTQINLSDGTNFTFTGKTFNFTITFASGAYDETMVDAITGKFTTKGSSKGTVTTTPQKPVDPPVVVLPTLTIGTSSAVITQQGTTNTYNVEITIPNSATTGQVSLTDGSNFTFTGKTFNFDITFASGISDEALVETIIEKFTAKGSSTGTVSTDPVIISPPTLKIDGVSITIPVPAEGVNTINISATVSNGVVADFADPSGILAGKVVNLTLSAPTGQNKINYSAISTIEAAFKAKGSFPSSNTIGGAIPVLFFDRILDQNGNIISDFSLLFSKATAENPEVKIVDNIKLLYNNGSPILKVQSPMQLSGVAFLTDLAKIETSTGMVHADESLRLLADEATYYDTTLDNFLKAYKACGFVVSPNAGIGASETYFDTDINATEVNNFFPKPAYKSISTGAEIAINITSQQPSWCIYKLYEQYYNASKLSELDHLYAPNITVAGDNATGLYGADNQPSASFPYKVNGEVLSAMYAFAGFENLYESTGSISWPANTGFSDRPYKIRNFATESQLLNNKLEANGGCFFQYAPTNVYTKTILAAKIMRVIAHCGINATYLDLRDLPLAEKANLGASGTTNSGGGEIAFASVAMLKSINDPGLVFPYSIGYANDSSGVTKLIGTTAEGFDPIFSSTRNNNIYGVLDLQGWTDATPPQDKTAASFPAEERWTASAFNALLQ